ncbi:MAG: phage baseplate assembly protein V [Reinekea sp.]
MNHSMGTLRDLHLARVLDNEDDDGRGRVQVEIVSTGAQLWASCMTSSAGANYGISCLPRVDEMVVLGFISPELPIVLGSLWSGADSHPQDAQAVQDKYAMISPEGTKVTLDDSDGPKVAIETSSGYHMTISEGGGGEITIEKGTESITLSSSGISIVSSGTVNVQAAKVDVSASMVSVDAAMSKFSGVVKCDSLIATSVVGTTYTPGAGNVW